MTDFVFPSDQARADDDELNRVCHELEDVMDLAEMDRKMAHVYRVENINLRSRLKALEAHLATLNEKAEACANELALMIDKHNTKNMEDGSFEYDHQTPYELMEVVRAMPVAPAKQGSRDE